MEQDLREIHPVTAKPSPSIADLLAKTPDDSSQPSPLKFRYVEQLTWLRGAAAFFVIVSHALRATEVAYTPADSPVHFLPLAWLDLGDFGVTVFFALSGLTLYLSNAQIATFQDVLGFYIKRFYRIWPAFAASFFVYVIFNHFFCWAYQGGLDGHLIEKHLLPYEGRDVIQYLTLTFNISGRPDLFNIAYWSLPVEFQYYFLFPLALVMLRRLGPLSLLALSAVLFATGSLHWVPMSSYKVLTLAFSFLGGMMVGAWYPRVQRKIPAGWAGGALLALFAMASAIYNRYIPLPEMAIADKASNYYVVLSVLTVAVVLFADFSRFPKPLKNLLRTYGDISYSTYLFHQVFAGLSVLFILNYQITGFSKLLFTFPFMVMATYVTAKFTYRWIEKPSTSFGQKLSRQWKARSAARKYGEKLPISIPE